MGSVFLTVVTVLACVPALAIMAMVIRDLFRCQPAFGLRRCHKCGGAVFRRCVQCANGR